MRIIYKNTDNSVGVLIPTQEALDIYGIEAIALKDTPSGLPYWIVPITDIPTDRSQREAWTMDEVANHPHGYGAILNTFEELV
jgi:hypothetical protein